jgi:hypothetical protein
MSRGKTARLAWTGSHNRYKKTNAIYKEAYEKIFKKNIEKKIKSTASTSGTSSTASDKSTLI